MWKYCRTGMLNEEEAHKRLSYCEMLIDEFVDISENNKEALLEGLRLKHSVYELLYFTLTRRHGAVLLTLDKKLRELARQNGIALAE
jgi:predicted nucleic acid-binding protein